MFELLYKKLRSLSHHTPLNRGIYQQLRAIFETGIDNQAIPNPDYLAICWLVKQKHITYTQAAEIVEELALEVLNSFLKLKEGSYEFIPESFLDDMPKFCYLDINLLVEQCQKQKRTSRNTQSNARVQNPRTESKAKSKTPEKNENLDDNYNYSQQRNYYKVNTKLYTIVCIDDSPTVLNFVNHCLDKQIFSFIGFHEPLKALIQILRTKPDVILLDIEMPNLDGYEFCSLLRKHSHFKNTPVIMVTSRTGLIDRAKAKLVKSSGYLTKPFTQSDLLKMLFQHIV
jgi:CheY-like chemotaxis protein